MPKLKEHDAATLPLDGLEHAPVAGEASDAAVALLVNDPSPEMPAEVADDSPAAEDAAEERSALDRYLEPTAFVAYLLERPGRSRIGTRRSFTNNVVARYLQNCTGQEWLVTNQAALNAGAMTSVPLPTWLRVALGKITSAEGLPEHVTPDEAIRATLSAMAYDLTLYVYNEMPF